MFEHFAKKNSGIYFSKNAKEKLMYFLGLKVTLD